ncbi:AraC family transcriptional regulator [Agrobacterium sp. NPDC090283]|uniref:AraC family transcriptional regulator n=1 Tax=Agrobacterium sp. NPDC090283 TaxID=3363920 RepID=UPI00383B63DD
MTDTMKIVVKAMRSKADEILSKGNIRYQGTDPDELSELMTRSISPVRVEALNKGGVSFEFEFASLGPIGFSSASYQGDSLWRLQPGNRSETLLIVLPSIGNSSLTIGQREVHAMPGSATIANGHRIESARTYGLGRHTTMTIEETRLLGRLSSMLERPVRGGLDIHPNVDLTTGPGQMLKHLVEAASSGVVGAAPLRQSPLALANLCETLSCLILETIPHRFSEDLLRPTAQPAPRHVKRAIDFMHAHVAEPMSLADIAAAANVSERCLQQGFRQFKTTTPMAYLQHLRLQGAHLDFLNHDHRMTIAGVALKWGFVHLGRFSALYRAVYKEKPSETVRRCPARTDL